MASLAILESFGSDLGLRFVAPTYEIPAMFLVLCFKQFGIDLKKIDTKLIASPSRICLVRESDNFSVTIRPSYPSTSGLSDSLIESIQKVYDSDFTRVPCRGPGPYDRGTKCDTKCDYDKVSKTCSKHVYSSCPDIFDVTHEDRSKLVNKRLDYDAYLICWTCRHG